MCLLGPSGCGKTTTLRMIAGFLEPDAGEIPRRREAGVVAAAVGEFPERRNMGMIFQSYAVWPHMTVHEQRRLRPQDEEGSAAERNARTDALLEATRLPELAARYPPSSPAGSSSASRWRARSRRARYPAAGRAACRISTPTCAARCAEPRSGACTTNRATTIYVTHDQVEAMTMADRIVVMNAGRIEQIGTPEEVTTGRSRGSSRASSARAM